MFSHVTILKFCEKFLICFWFLLVYQIPCRPAIRTPCSRPSTERGLPSTSAQEEPASHDADAPFPSHQGPKRHWITEASPPGTARSVLSARTRRYTHTRTKINIDRCLQLQFHVMIQNGKHDMLSGSDFCFRFEIGSRSVCALILFALMNLSARLIRSERKEMLHE